MTTHKRTMAALSAKQPDHFQPLLQSAKHLTTPLPADGDGTWPAAPHVWRPDELDALAAAAFSGRPLLVRGEPGVGKSQIARAAAALLGWRFVYQVITPRFEPEHLKWRYDAVRRLSDATCHRPVDDERRYIDAGVLWQALCPASAAVLAALKLPAATMPPTEPGAPPPTPLPATQLTGCVLLIDEIDKADSDLPNSLLEVLANRAFTSPVGRVPKDPQTEPAVLIVITSNDERELPAAFMRRCVVLDLSPPEHTPKAFIDWLLQRGQAHFSSLEPSVRKAAAVQVQADRALCLPGQGPRPGGAEYLDLLKALQGIAPGDPAAQRRWLKRLSRYVLRKQGQQQQADGTASPGDAPADD